MRLWVRLALAAALVALLCGSFVHYDIAEDRTDPYPETERLVTDYDAHVGERTLLFGTVQSVTDGTLVIDVDSDAGTVTMTVPDADADVRPGGVVQVYGTLEPDRTIRPERTVVVNGDGGAELYKYAVSAVGALAVVGLFGRHWRLDTEAWALEVREDG